MEGAYKGQVHFLPSIIRLGVKSLKCRRYGICEIKVLDGFQSILNPFDRRSYALLQVSRFHLVGIHFLRKSMSEWSLNKYFCNNVFTIEESYRFNVQLDRCKMEYEIPKMNYPVLDKSGYLSIKIKNIAGELIYPHNPYELNLSNSLGKGDIQY